MLRKPFTLSIYSNKEQKKYFTIINSVMLVTHVEGQKGQKSANWFEIILPGIKIATAHFIIRGDWRF
jgi:hypothetical protein